MGINIENKVAQASEKIGDLATPLTLALKYMHDDPSGSLGKSRVVLERLILKMFIAKTGKEPKKPEIGFMLNVKYFTQNIERRIVSDMHAVRDKANLGAHGENVVSDDAKNSSEARIH